MNWYLEVLKKYAEFGGRARRKEYWMFVLFNVIISIVLNVLAIALHFLSVVGMLYALAVLIPGIAVGIRRLHDTNRSGWWLLLAIVPLANLALLVFMCLDGTPGDNQFGPNPKAAPSA